jgi:L-ascorbate metabolism protein UlaG (beta-lactamase superfamily)
VKALTESGAVDVVPLGQAGFRFAFGGTTIYVDPYLSDNARDAGGHRLKRLVPIWKDPALIHDADWCFLTHVHADHCDPFTLVPLSRSSPRCRFVGPPPVARALAAAGIAPERITSAGGRWLECGTRVRACAAPAAHPTIEVDDAGAPQCVGYVFDFGGRRAYHAGDTSLTAELVEAVQRFKPLDVAILPVNERNYYREARGIVGNMTVREAFQFADDLGVSLLVPMHWDMFSANNVHREELELHYRLSRPSFTMRVNPAHL